MTNSKSASDRGPYASAIQELAFNVRKTIEFLGHGNQERFILQFET